VHKENKFNIGSDGDPCHLVQIRMFLGLPDPDPNPLVRGTDPDSADLELDPDPDPLGRGTDPIRVIWCGCGFTDPYLCLMDPDRTPDLPDPDPYL
jgi:hypothetical protein